jgi:hypothetical protein
MDFSIYRKGDRVGIPIAFGHSSKNLFQFSIPHNGINPHPDRSRGSAL